MLVFEKEGKLESLEKNPWKKDKNPQKSQPTRDAKLTLPTDFFYLFFFLAKNNFIELNFIFIWSFSKNEHQ